MGTPTASVRRGIERASYGFLQIARAAKLVVEHPKLRWAALWPTAWTLSACLLFAWLTMDEDSGVPQWRAFLTAFATLSALPPTLLMPLWTALALRIRRELGAIEGDNEGAALGYFRMLRRECSKAIRQAILVSVGVLPLIVVGKIASLPQFFSHGISATWAFYWVVLDALELPIEVAPGHLGEGELAWFERALRRAKLGLFARLVGRLAKPWRHAVHFTEQRAPETAGFALASGLFLLLPGVGLFFRAIVITAATCMVVDDERSARIAPR